MQRQVCTYYGCPLMAPVHIPYKLCPMLDKKVNSLVKQTISDSPLHLWAHNKIHHMEFQTFSHTNMTDPVNM
jgi:hypothetical protein